MLMRAVAPAGTVTASLKALVLFVQELFTSLRGVRIVAEALGRLAGT